jgi:hypothetical protein
MTASTAPVSAQGAVRTKVGRWGRMTLATHRHAPAFSTPSMNSPLLCNSGHSRNTTYAVHLP